jgi:hypothetical protein
VVREEVVSKVGRRRLVHVRWLLKTWLESERPRCCFCLQRIDPGDVAGDAKITLHHVSYDPPKVKMDFIHGRKFETENRNGNGGNK